MRRAGRILAWVLGVAVALPLLLLAAANTGPGRQALQSLIAWASGGTVRLSGLSGRFPDAPRIERLELLDRGGVYATVTDAVLDWAPLQAVHGVMDVDRLSAARIAVARLPVSEGGTSTDSTGLPLRLAVKTLHVDRLELAAPVAGTPTALTLDASGTLDSLTSGRGQLHARTVDDGGTYDVAGSAGPDGLRDFLESLAI